MIQSHPSPPFPSLDSCTVAVIGLGYVGLPLAACFASTKRCFRSQVDLNRRIIGYDLNICRVNELRDCYDRTRELSAEELRNSISCGLEITADSAILADADVYIVTVPTPIDSSKRPDLTPLCIASQAVGEAMRLRSDRKLVTQPIVIYESTVYPGATEEECVPLLEKFSGLSFNKDFTVGYSPERLVPGDKEHMFSNTLKITSGSSPQSSAWIDDFYGSVVVAGTYLAKSIKIAEAAKVIENTQRDINIALVNELAIIFNLMDIDTSDVLAAASTKWNFLPFKPGLVGGHCIGVDPYYLTHKAQQLGHHPEVILAGRRINDGLPEWLVGRLIKSMAFNGLIIKGAKVLVLGITFKENCPDLRNTRVLALVECLGLYGCVVTIVDPWVDKNDPIMKKLKIKSHVPLGEKYSAVVAAVAHQQFIDFNAGVWSALLKENGVLMDLKNIIPREINTLRL